MKRLALTRFSMNHPWLVLVSVLALTGFLGSRFPSVHFDNDPENMLAEDEAVRVFHHEVKEQYALYDFVIVGIVNNQHPDGVFNVDTLGRIDDLTRELLSLHRNDEGRPAVVRPSRGSRPEEVRVPDLHPKGTRQRLLAAAFRRDAEDLFDEQGESVIISREIISPSVVDNIKQAELGQLKIEYLMEQPPVTREEALVIRDDAMSNPLYRGTLVAEDGKALCLYLPIVAKPYSYNVANLVRVLTEDWDPADEVHITGLPVAEDTFGVEMLIQMATSAPMAGLCIFLLLFLFFRRLSLIIAPMLLAVFTVVCTMGLLIGLGFDVHIMSSMIAIFLMPIAVADSVHVLSEFFDVYHRFGNKRDTVRHIIGHLFRPMLFTSLTTMAGFASLGLTPIPPVRIFGLHIAFGVGLAWFLTMTFIPAYIILFVSERSLEGRTQPAGDDVRHRTGLDRFLDWVGLFTLRRSRGILVFALLVAAVAGYGISRIEVNDNPVRWFSKKHPIRVADRVLNDHFGGTYTAYLTLAPAGEDTRTFAHQAALLSEEASRRYGESNPGGLKEFLAAVERHGKRFGGERASDLQTHFGELKAAVTQMDQAFLASWNALADAVLYADPERLTASSLAALLDTVEKSRPEHRARLLDMLRAEPSAPAGEALQERAMAACEQQIASAFSTFLSDMEAALIAPPFKQPDVLAYVEALQQHLAGLVKVGKTSSAVDALKKASYELNYVEGETAGRNDAFFSIPPSPAAVGQVFTQLEGMKKKDSLFHLVTRDYTGANLWVQLTSGDNRDMEGVVQSVNRYVEENPPPSSLQAEWAGLTYINVVWQDRMVVGMLSALASSFVVVLLMMMVLFRSPLFAVLSMVPLSVTIAFIYGLIGLMGKDYDMPVAVLSALTLGLSIDFAIHFLERTREFHARLGSWEEAGKAMFREPAMAISRNAIIIAIGFTPLLFAPLVPYKTVGFFLATIMLVSWLGTLFLLPALVTQFQRFVFKSNRKQGTSS